MGRFVVEFDGANPEDWDRQQQQQVSFVTAEEKKPRDGWFQKGLCYASYYSMAFSALCAFSPNTVASAAEMIKSSVL